MVELSSLLKFEDVSLSFGGITALKNVSFDVKEKSITSIIGPNGAGKTSVFNCISGIYSPDSGNIFFEDANITNMRPNKIAELGIARTFQNIELFENLSVLENILTGVHRRLDYGILSGLFYSSKAKKGELYARKEAEDIIDFLEIEEYRYSYVMSLPYGIQKRVELGRALALAPKLILLDEPAAGMNNEETEDIARFIIDINEELKISVLLVDHDMNMVTDIAHEITVLNFGEKIADGTPNEVIENSSVIEAYVGSSKK
jgi:branched-chain amino acid transport system ATP-binding protein|tara:strand:- start:5180 stop:5959 length:780 start_codon:yes stop_codon:yes gene_type:complete